MFFLAPRAAKIDNPTSGGLLEQSAPPQRPKSAGTKRCVEYCLLMSDSEQTPQLSHIVDDITRKIVAGDIHPGAQVPTPEQIIDQWGVGEETAAQVAPALRHAGLTATVPGVGVVALSQHGGQQRLRTAATTGKIYPPGHAARILSSDIVAAPDEVAIQLGLPDGNREAVRRVRVTEAFGKPVSTSVSWHDARYAVDVPELLKPERMLGGSVRLIRERCEVRATHGREEVRATVATADIAELLGIEEGTPVLATRCWVIANDAVIEYAEGARLQDQSTMYEYPL